jgi:hypothetical protein
VSINALKAPLGDGGLATLVAALRGTQVQSICGLTEGQAAASFFGQGLTPYDAAVIAAELRLPGRASTLTSLDVSDNDLLGNCTSVAGCGDDDHSHVDSDMSGWNVLCDAVRDCTALVEFRCAKVGMGPSGCRRLAQSLPRQLASLKVTATGRTQRLAHQREYTLATTATVLPPRVCMGTFAQTPDGRLGEVIAQDKEVWVRLRWIDSGSHLGIQTSSESTDWIHKDQLSEHLVKSDCPITKGGMATYQGRLGTVIALDKAVWARMQFIDDGSETLDWISTEELVSFTRSVFTAKSYRLSSKDLSDADASLLCSWFSKPEVRAAVTDVDVSGNPLAKNSTSVSALIAALPHGAALRGVPPQQL